jgi:hypothetical protein
MLQGVSIAIQRISGQKGVEPLLGPIHFEQYTRSQALKIRKWYMWYTTCPRCAKKYGKNYVAVLAEVEKS